MGILALILACLVALAFLRRLSNLELSNYSFAARSVLSAARAAGIAFLVSSVALVAAYYLAPRLDAAAANFVLLAQLAGPVTFVILLISFYFKLLRK